MTTSQSHPRHDPPNDVANYHRAELEMRQVWERCGLVRPGETVDSYVLMLGCSDYDENGDGYRRIDRVVPAGATRGESKMLLDEGRKMLVRSEQRRSPGTDPG